jgi:hypothetical protein
LFFPQLAHGASIPSDRSKLQKRGGDNAIGLSGLVATIIGVLITAIGVFGWKFWRGRWNVTKVMSYSLLFPDGRLTSAIE